MDTLSQPTLQVYDSLEMPMCIWIDALCDGETSRIKGFRKLYYEFCEGVGGRELIRKLEEVTELAYLEAKVTAGVKAIEMLRMKPSESLFNEMLKLGYNTSVVTYDVDKIPQFIKQIEPFIYLDDVDAKILRARSGGGPKDGYSRDYFSSMFNEFLIVFKISVDEQTLSVRRYVNLVKRYKSHKKELEKQ